MNKKLTRAEVSKQFRQILSRHRVDISLITYQGHGYEIEVLGIMWHTNDTDFTHQEIDALLKDFQNKLPGYELSGKTENWHFSSHGIKGIGANAQADEKEEAPEETTQVA